MIKFSQIIECVVDVTPAGRRHGLDYPKRENRGLLGIDTDGDLFRYNYDTKEWTKELVIRA